MHNDRDTVENSKFKNSDVGLHSDGSRPLSVKNSTFTGHKVGLMLGGNPDSIISKEPKIPQSKKTAKTKNDWYQKPIGIIGLSVTGIFIATCLVWIVNHYFNLGL